MEVKKKVKETFVPPWKDKKNGFVSLLQVKTLMFQQVTCRAIGANRTAGVSVFMPPGLN